MNEWMKIALLSDILIHPSLPGAGREPLGANDVPTYFTYCLGYDINVKTLVQYLIVYAAVGPDNPGGGTVRCLPSLTGHRERENRGGGIG